MPAEATETTFDTEYGGFIAPEYEQQAEGAPHNKTELVGANDNEPVPEQFESLDFLTQLVIDHKGGTPADWTSEFSGTGFTFDGMYVRDEQGEIWPHAAPEMLAAWQNNESSVFRLPDYEERVGDVIKLSVTHIVREPDNTVRYEIHSTRFAVSEPEESHPLQDWKNLDTTPTLWQRESLYSVDAEASVEEVPLETFQKGAARELEAVETIETPLQTEEDTAHVLEEPGVSEVTAQEYTYSAVLKSLENLAVFSFPDEHGAETPETILDTASFADQRDLAQPSTLVQKTEVVASSTVIEEISPVEVGTSPSGIEQGAFRPTETKEPVKPVETAIEPAGAPTELSITPSAEPAAIYPTRATPASSETIPTTIEEAEMQEAVQQLLADAPLDAFLEEPLPLTMPSAAAVPERISPIPSQVQEDTKRQRPTDMRAPILEMPRSAEEITTAESAGKASLEKQVLKSLEEIPARPLDMMIVPTERAANDDEIAAERFRVVSTESAVLAPFISEGQRTQRFSPLSEDDIPTTSKESIPPSSFTSRNGISMSRAA